MFGFLYAPTKSCGTTARGFYQSTFCGLACQMHRDYGPLARFLINRDSTFLALAGVSLDSSSTELESRTCCNPLANAKPVVAADQHLQYAAAITVCGLSAKLRDNADDERGWRAGVPRIAGNLIAPARDTATAVLNSCGFPVQHVESLLSEQQKIEADGADMMTASEPTAQSYGTIFSHLANQSGSLLEKPRLFQLGSSLGRLIYWQDAIDDQKSDAKHGRFNPLSQHPDTDAPSLMKAEFARLKNSVQNIGWQRNATLITDIIGHTQLHQEAGQSKIKKRRASSAKKDKWYDAWCCCDSISCCDADCSSCCSSAGDAGSGGCSGCGGCDGCDCCGGCDCCSCGS